MSDDPIREMAVEQAWDDAKQSAQVTRPGVEGEALTIASRVKLALDILGGVDTRYNVAIECLLDTAVEVQRREERIAELRSENDHLIVEMEQLRRKSQMFKEAADLWRGDFGGAMDANTTLTAEVERLQEAVRAWLTENDTEGFGCACQFPHECGTCQWRKRSERLRLLTKVVEQ